MKPLNLTKSWDVKFFADKLLRGEKFSIARYGDGELKCMNGHQGQNSQGCVYTPELRTDLLNSLSHKDGLYHLVSSTMLIPDQLDFIKYMKPGVEWGDTEHFPWAFMKSELKIFFDALRQRQPLTIISSKEKRGVPIPYDRFIEVPRSNTHAEKARVIAEIGSGEGVFLFSCGMAAGTIAYDLHDKLPGTFIDFGHLLDPLVGEMSRGYLEEMTHRQIFENI